MRYSAIVGAVGFCIIAGTGLVQSSDRKPNEASTKKLPAYGTASDVTYAKELWKRLREERLVGNRRFSPRPTKGHNPHGSIQQILAGTIPVKGRATQVVVKANHRGKGVSPEGVFEDPKRFLTGYAVMAKREQGYHAEHADWFWALFNPNGSLRKFEGKPIAGRVDTGAENGCIGCHKKWGGKDYLSLTRQ